MSDGTIEAPSLPLAEELARSNQRKQTIFYSLLACIALLGLAVRLYVGSRSFMELDEWQHVFISASPRLADLQYELNQEAHPILSYWILRWLLHFGHGTLWYRIPTIAAAAGSICLVGLICRRVCRNLPFALLAALALALSSVAITISTEVRSYELSVCFCLLSFFHFLYLFDPSPREPRIRTYIGFSLGMCLALESEYFAVLVLGACIAATFLLASFSGEIRQRFSPRKNTLNLILLVASFSLPLGLMTAMYLGPLSNQPIQGYLYNFYWHFTPGESQSQFLLRNLLNEWNLFSPISIHQAETALRVVLLLVFASGYFWLSRMSWLALQNASDLRSAQLTLASAIPYPFILLLLIELSILSLQNSYPFGGLMRQQYVVLPFLVIAGSTSADQIVSTFRKYTQPSVPIVIAASIVLNFVMSAHSLVLHPGWVLNESDYDKYRAAFPNAPAVYLSHFTVIQFFEMTADEPRQFVRRVTDSAWIDEFRMGLPGKPSTEIFYDKDRYVPDLTSPLLYQSLVHCLKESRVPEIVLFHLVPGKAPFPEQAESLPKTIAERAALQGLSVDQIVIDDNARSVFAGFHLQ